MEYSMSKGLMMDMFPEQTCLCLSHCFEVRKSYLCSKQQTDRMLKY